MSVTEDSTAPAGVVGTLSTLDRFLPVWIAAAMVVGLLGGRSIPGLNTALNTVSVNGISLPIAIGLLITTIVYRTVPLQRTHAHAADSSSTPTR